jgi:phosphoenolpyruvate carboxykinase (ATP)
MEIAHTRAMIKAILDGEMDSVPTFEDPVFGLHIPEQVSNVPTEILNPRNTWKHPDLYDQKARELAAQFVENFKEYEASVTQDILSASPRPNASVGNESAKIHKLK